jgi:hypothetical protein
LIKEAAILSSVIQHTRYIFNSKELEELHDDMAVRENQEVALELIKPS